MKGMAFLRNILFCLSDVLLQRYNPSMFEKNAIFTKSAAVHNFYIANSPWNLDLNLKSHKICKNKKGMAFLRNILFCLSDVSLQRYDQCCGSGMFIPDPGSWFLPIPDPGSRIPDPKTGRKERDEKKIFVKHFFVTTNFTKCNII
jgi:hypothetical protein